MGNDPVNLVDPDGGSGILTGIYQLFNNPCSVSYTGTPSSLSAADGPFTALAAAFGNYQTSTNFFNTLNKNIAIIQYNSANFSGRGTNNSVSPIYDHLGNFLGTDKQGFSGDVIFMSSTQYSFLSILSGNKPISHNIALNLGQTLGNMIDNFGKIDKGIIQLDVINKVINDVVNRTPNIKGFEPNKLHNGSVSSGYDNGFNDDDLRVYGYSNDGEVGDNFNFANTIGNKVTFNLKSWSSKEKVDSKLSPTVENLQNTYSHEAGGHFFHKWGDDTKTHFKVIKFQMNHSTWKGTTMSFKQTLSNLYNEYKKDENGYK